MKPNPDHYAIIMAGGGGERFWPLSRMRTPKQLLALVTKRTLIEETVARVSPMFRRENILVVTNREQAPKIRALLPQIPGRNIIAEPLRRDTAAAVGLGAAIVSQRNPRGVMTLLASDHVIHDDGKYRSLLADCFVIAERREVLVTIGTKPAGPNTGYGYIELGSPLRTGTRTRFFHAKRFVEKPDLATARTYVSTGRYRWNAGMFVWSVNSIWDGLLAHLPDHAFKLRQIQAAVDTPRFEATLRRVFPTLERISIDYGLMEKANNVVVGDGAFDWDDVGSWVALENHLPRADGNNVTRGKVLSLRSSHNIVVADKRLIATLGVRDLIIVETDDALLVCHRDEAQKIKEIVNVLSRHPKWKKHTA